VSKLLIANAKRFVNPLWRAQGSRPLEGVLMPSYRPFAYAAATALALGTATGAQALTINLINTGGVEEGTAAFIGFSAAARYWESVLKDDVTLNFRVGFSSQGFDPNTLGSTSSASSNKAQGIWRDALVAHAVTPLDAIAVAHLPTFTNANVNLNNTLQKALGIYTGTDTAIDATIRFNSARPFDFDTRDGFQNVASDFVGVAVHEMGHALGFTSAVGQSTTNASRPSNTDMFRYKNGAWNITWGEDPYFSIDGGASEVFGRSDFSPGSDGFQTSHWQEGLRQHDGIHCTVLLEPQIGILDPTGGLCQEGIVTGQDLALFDAIGWNLGLDILSNPNYKKSTSRILWDYFAVPEPSNWAMMIAGFGLIGAAMRRRAKTTARFA
jgi:hypothetical protein